METPKIVELQINDVLRVSAVHIRPDPDGSLVVVGGLNGQGKTSVLDAIEIALRGAASMPPEPIRKGAKRGKITIDLGTLIAERVITEGGHRLTVKNKEGVPLASPQAVLDELVGKLAYDPLKFLKSNEKDQLETLKQLAGLDFTELDAKRKTAYDARTETNRKFKECEVQAANMPAKDFATNQGVMRISTQELTDKLKSAEAINDGIRKKKTELTTARDLFREVGQNIMQKQAEISELKFKIANLEEEIAKDKKAQADMIPAAKALAAEIEKLNPVDVADVTVKLEAAQDNNKDFEARADYNKKVAEAQALKAEAEKLDKAIADIDKTKQGLVEKAKLPLAGLSVSDKEVLYNGLPLKQSSGAEQLRVSAAMGMALSGKLKVMLIRDASLLDDQSMALLGKMASENNHQCWLERVGSGKECHVILEDGHVAENRTVSAVVE